MEGRKHTGVVVVSSSNADAAQGQAWEARWRERASPDAIAFRISDGYEFGGVTHVAIHETQSDDVAAAEPTVGAGDGETVASYTKFAEYGPTTEGRTAGVVLVFTDCDDPALEDAYNEWYTGHLSHTVDAIDFYAASRYVSNDPSRTPSKYLAIYESQSDDPAQVQKDGIDWWVNGGFEGPEGMLLRNEVPGERVD